MSFAFRFADPHTAARFPLAVAGEINWQRDKEVFRFQLSLPELPSGTILVPSLSISGENDYRFRFGLDVAKSTESVDSGENTFLLNEVPSKSSVENVQTEDRDVSGMNFPVSTHIDCFHTHEHIPASTLTLEAEGLDTTTPYLLSVTSRRLERDPVTLPQRAVCAPFPPSLSQMTANRKIKHSICSPTCIAMLLAHFEKPIDWLEFIDTCRDQITGMYGIWPLGIWAASRQGCLGSVEVFDDWEQVTRLLEHDLPFVASIRYPEGTLPGAPLKKTSGHLVVVYGMDELNVHVLDPAAPTAAEVMRTYPADAFSNSWLRYRGAAYILLP